MPVVDQNTVVVIGRRPPSGPKPEDSYSADDIASFGTSSVGETVDRVKEGLPGDPDKIPVTVNGRRLGSLADIVSLPAGAIDHVDVLPPVAGFRQGFTGAQPVVNVVLRQHYHAQTMETEASTTDHAKGTSESGTWRLAAIDGDNRKNVAITAAHSDGIHAHDRFDDRSISAAAPYTTANSSLTAESDKTDFNSGYAVPLGKNNLSISANASYSQIRRNLAISNQRQNVENIGASVSTSLDGISGDKYWSMNIILTGNHSLTNVNGKNGEIEPLNFTKSDNISMDLKLNYSGSFSRIFKNMVSYDLIFNYEKGLIHQGDGYLTKKEDKYFQNLISSAGLSVVLHDRGGSRSVLGQIMFAGHVNAQRTTGSDWISGYDANLSWSPLDGLLFAVNRSVIGSPGAIASPLLLQTNVLMYDYKTQQDVRVTQLSGSNMGLRPSNNSTTDLRATFMHRLKPAAVSLSVNYTVSQSKNPSWEPSLSDIAEQAFPDHFLRDPTGQLIQIDLRPVNAFRQSASQLGINLHLSGGRHRAISSRRRSRADNNGPVQMAPFTWNFTVVSSWKLDDTLKLTASSPIYDLDTASIGASGSASRTTSIMGSMLLGRFGAEVSANWSSSRRILGQGGSDGLYRPPIQINISASARLWAGPKPDSGLHLTLRVNNLLNSRAIISYPDRATPFSQLPASLDPVGRLIRLSLRTNFE